MALNALLFRSIGDACMSTVSSFHSHRSSRATGTFGTRKVELYRRAVCVDHCAILRVARYLRVLLSTHVGACVVVKGGCVRLVGFMLGWIAGGVHCLKGSA